MLLAVSCQMTATYPFVCGSAIVHVWEFKGWTISQHKHCQTQTLQCSPPREAHSWWFKDRIYKILQSNYARVTSSFATEFFDRRRILLPATQCSLTPNNNQLSSLPIFEPRKIPFDPAETRGCATWKTSCLPVTHHCKRRGTVRLCIKPYHALCTASLCCVLSFVCRHRIGYHLLNQLNRRVWNLWEWPYWLIN